MKEREINSKCTFLLSPGVLLKLLIYNYTKLRLMSRDLLKDRRVSTANVHGIVLSSPEVRGGQRSVDRRISSGEIRPRTGEEPAGRTPREKCRDVCMRRIRAHSHARHLAGHTRYILDLRS